MTRKSEYDAAYFTLLRAREELEHLRRYQEYLEQELARLAAFVRDINDGPEVVPRKFRRMLDSTAKQVVEAVGRRRAIVLSERDAVPQRIDDQEAFVRELEDEVATLRA